MKGTILKRFLHSAFGLGRNDCSTRWILGIVVLLVFGSNTVVLSVGDQGRYVDRPFGQDWAEKVPVTEELKGAELWAVGADRNGRVLALSDKGLLQVHEGRLVPEGQYRPLSAMKIHDLAVFQDQFMYLTDKEVLSNAWAGRFWVTHKIAEARWLEMGSDYEFMVGGKEQIAYFDKDKQATKWKAGPEPIMQIVYDEAGKRFFLLTDAKVECFTPGKGVVRVYEGENLRCLEMVRNNSVLLVGMQEGYVELDGKTFRKQGEVQSKLPEPDIRCVKEIGGKVWFGTEKGAFALGPEGRIDYYAGGRWLVDDSVRGIAEGPDERVLVLSKEGLSIIHFDKMTLEEKADHFDRLTRERHVRFGFNSALTLSKPGDLATGTLIDQDNDGLWTCMYLGGELFRYKVTGSEAALANCYEAFEALERLESINPLKGFPARSFEHRGYHVADKKRWRDAEDPHWTWKATTSSDEIVGHFFAYSIFAEIVPEKEWRERAITLMDKIMDHIVRNDWYLIDYDGKPTLWGKWNPEYVNQFPKQVGDRRLNSVEIISFLQTAYHFTRKEIYKEKAYELMEKHGYLDNIMIPITEIGFVPGQFLSDVWNHSDDELAFLSYWILYKYAFTEELRGKYRRTIKGHWEIERPEKNPLWNFIYAMTGAKEFDLEESVWSLQEFPLDMISWTVRNSGRKDLEFLKENFRKQTTRKVLPPDERPMGKHNINAFRLDGGNGGRREYSGDIYLLPYWMGRYLGVIQ